MKNNRGFMLLESMIAAAILFGSVLLLLTTLGFLVGQEHDSRERLEMCIFLHELQQVEEKKANPVIQREVQMTLEANDWVLTKWESNGIIVSNGTTEVSVRATE